MAGSPHKLLARKIALKVHTLPEFDVAIVEHFLHK